MTHLHPTSPDTQLRISLFLLRLGVFIVMAMWSLDKLLVPEHAAKVFAHFYYLSDIGSGTLLAIGLAQLAVEIAFLAGLYKTFTYGFVLVTHTVSVASSWKQYLAPFDNMLFLAAIPMLSASIALFLLRKHDTFLTLAPTDNQASTSPH